METKTVINGNTTFADFKKQFEKLELSGYIWMVEGKEPIILPNKIDFENLNEKGNVYNKIQEAYLTDGVYSIKITNIDGAEYIFNFSEEDFKDDTLFKIGGLNSYPSHIKGIDTIHFKQVYKLTTSISSAEFKTWQPIVKLFKGINLK